MTLNEGTPRFTFNITWAEGNVPEDVPEGTWEAHVAVAVHEVRNTESADLSTQPESASLSMVDAVSGVASDGGFEGVKVSAGEEKSFHFDPGAATGLTLSVVPAVSTFDATVDVRPPSVSGVGSRTIRGKSRIAAAFGNGSTSLDGTWRVTVTPYVDTEYSVFWKAGDKSIDLPSIAPDGSLDTYINRNFGYGREHVYVPNGTEKTFYATVKSPQLPDGFIPKTIKFSWEDESGKGLGSVFVSVEQMSGPKLVLDSDSAQASGSIVFSSNRGTSLPYTPENVTLGYYIITLRGVSSQPGGEYYSVHWNVS
jgi:hypothetical protein